MSLQEIEPVLTDLKLFNNKGTNRYTYCIVVKNEEGELELHERRGEPCYGGLRKYVSTHGKEATQPEGKPGDLNNPFPKGEPIAVAFPFNHIYVKKYHRLVDYIWGDNSPWIKGFGGVNNIMRTYSEAGNHSGMILLDAEIDPTVLVNLCKFTYATLPSVIDKWNTLIAEDMTDFEALCCVTLDSRTGYYPSMWDNYMFPKFVNLGKMAKGVVNDFSKGTLRKRFDYSRRNIQDIFKDDNGIILVEAMKKEWPKEDIPVDKKAKVYAEVAKKVIRKYM